MRALVSRRRAATLLASAALVCAAIALAGGIARRERIEEWIASRRVGWLFGKVVKAANERPSRAVEGRLHGGFEHRPLRIDRGGDGLRDWQVQGALGALRSYAADHPVPESSSRVGAALLAAGREDDAIEQFERALRGGSDDAVTDLLSAGAGRVVAARWDVSDADSSALFREFYAGIARGEDLATALQQAQLSVLKRHRNAHPQRWAAYQVYGGNG